jgi:hypothetical protein
MKNKFGKNFLKLGLAASLFAGTEAAAQNQNKPENLYTGDKTEMTAEKNSSENNFKVLTESEMHQIITENIKDSELQTLLLKKNLIDGDYQEAMTNFWKAESAAASAPDNKDAQTDFLTKKEHFEKIKQISDSLDKDISSLEAENFSDRQQKIIEQAPQMFEAAEQARQEALNIITTPDYVDKLQVEFSCTREEALKIQTSRLYHIKKTPFSFASSENLANYGAAAFYNSRDFFDGKGKISLPYDVTPEKLVQLGTHEFLHSATKGDLELSDKAKEKLQGSFVSQTDKSADYVKYMKIPTERYVRLKILQEELNRLGLKQTGEKFTKETYIKMMKLVKKQQAGKLNNPDEGFNKNALEFIEWTKDDSAVYEDLFNDLAETKSDKADKDYVYPGWDYNQNNFA